ncbi:MAG: hypothetical protein JW927_14860, partial [Deltaproteobacteria bacterium]|nr:hypothetical protein [Deltaproteobacteria bacterium]
TYRLGVPYAFTIFSIPYKPLSPSLRGLGVLRLSVPSPMVYAPKKQPTDNIEKIPYRSLWFSCDSGTLFNSALLADRPTPFKAELQKK